MQKTNLGWGILRLILLVVASLNAIESASLFLIARIGEGLVAGGFASIYMLAATSDLEKIFLSRRRDIGSISANETFCRNPILFSACSIIAVTAVVFGLLLQI